MINDDPTPTSVVGLLTSNSTGMAIMQSFPKKFKVPFCKKKKVLSKRFYFNGNTIGFRQLKLSSIFRCDNMY